MITKSTLTWFEKFRTNDNWNHLRFKKLNTSYPTFDFIECLIDEVSIEEFLLEESNRIPLFLGSQFGVEPNPKEIFNTVQKTILVAKLDKSLLSGVVSGCSICIYKEDKFQEIEFFKN